MDFETLEPKTAGTPGPAHFQLCKTEQEMEYKDAKGENNGNWMTYANWARNDDEKNLVALQHQEGILYRCCRPINLGQELSSKSELAEDLRVTSDCLKNKRGTDNELNATQEVIYCSFCHLSYTSQVDLDRHVKKCHCPEHEILPKSEAIKHENPILSMLGEGVVTPVDDVHGTFQNISVKKEEPDDQDPFFCELCRTFFTTECNVHGSPIFVPDTPVPMGVMDRAIQSLPSGLEVRKSSIPDEGFGVFNKGDIIPIGVHFGPCQGKAMDGYYSVAIYKREQENEYKDANVEKHCNWMRYVNCARNNDEQNLVAFQHRGGILYRCCRPINPGQELFLSYKEELAEDLSVTSDCLHNKKCTDNELIGTRHVCCSFCQLSYTSQVDLDRHVKLYHWPEYEILPKSEEIEHENLIPTSSSSRLCGKFQMPANIKVYCCSVCGKRFTQKSHLQLHQHIHTGEKPYLCMQCGKNFTQQSSLQLHQHIHRGDKLYPCMQCLKNFKHQSSLQRHQRIHTGEKPYHCTQCGKNFTHLYYLQQHRRIHTGEKPYQCTQCRKNFTHQSNFQRHQRIHIGEKPYHCSECGKNFTHQSSLQRHQRIHTGEKP